MSAAHPMSTCELCGVYGPCKRVTFFQNVGVLIMRFPRTLSGSLCKRCIDSNFVRMSAISFFFGWWGVISFFYTAVTLPLNVITWLGTLSLPAPPPIELAGSDPGFRPPHGPGPSPLHGVGAPAAGPAPSGGVGPHPSAGFEPPRPEGFGPPSASTFGPPTETAPYGAAPHGAFAASSVPTHATSSSGRGIDVLAIVAILLGVLAVGANALVGLISVGMMVSPHQPDDPKSGAICLIVSSIACGLPGVLGLAAGGYRFYQRKRAS
ncbi:MAG: hypothetical protein AB7S26_18495 [Sandaracinaceae bacterium]